MSWWPQAPLSSRVAQSTAHTGTDPSLRTVFGDGLTPTSLSDRDDILDGWKLLPLGGCSRPELWGCVCWGWAHSLWPGLLGAAGQAGHSGWGRWRTEASRAWGGTGGCARHCRDTTGPATSLRAPKAAPRPGRRLPCQSRLSAEVECPGCGLARHKACCVTPAVGVAVPRPSAEPSTALHRHLVRSLYGLVGWVRVGSWGARPCSQGPPSLHGGTGVGMTHFPSLL